MNALCILTITPHSHSLDFLEEFANRYNNYKVFICCDNSEYLLPKTYKNITIIQYSEEECIEQGYKESASICTNLKDVVAWDKSLKYFCNDFNNQFEHVWLVEEDVFIPTYEIIYNIDSKYVDADLLSLTHIINDTNMTDWHWLRAADKHPPPWASSLVCICRLSKTQQDHIKRYVDNNKRLSFVEFMFNTLALHNNLKVENPEEFLGMTCNIPVTEVSKERVFHPLKDMELQSKLFKELNNLD
jgi:hypothetical protein